MASAPLAEIPQLLDLEPLSLDEQARRPEEGGAWTRRRLRARLWSQREALARCMRQADRREPMIDGRVQLVIELAHPRARVESPRQQLAGCIERALRTMPARALATGTRYTITLELPELARPQLEQLYYLTPRLQIAGASPGLVPGYEEIDAPETSAPAPGQLEPPGRQGQALAEVLTRHGDGLVTCYGEARRDNPDLRGELGATLRLGREGRVQRIWWDRDTLGDPGLRACADRLIRSWRFRLREEPLEVGVSWSLEPPRVPEAPAPPGPFGSGGWSSGPGVVALDELVIDRVRARRGALAACHKRWVGGRAAGALVLRVRVDSRYPTSTGVEVAWRERPHEDLERCLRRALGELWVPPFEAIEQPFIAVVDVPVEFVAPGRGRGTVDGELEARLLERLEEPRPQEGLLRPGRREDLGELERAARVLEVNGQAAGAVALRLELVERTQDPVARLRHLERLLQVAQRQPPPLYHQTLRALAAREALVGQAPALVERQAEAALEARLREAAQQVHRRARQVGEAPALYARAARLHELYEARASSPRPEMVFEHAELLFALERWDEAARRYERYLMLAPGAEFITEARSAALVARRRQLARDCPLEEWTRYGRAPEVCFEALLERADAIIAEESLPDELRAEALVITIKILRDYGYPVRAEQRHERLLADFDPIYVPADLTP